jgi:hypothetical protein
MKTVRRKDGVIYIFDRQDEICPPGEICFFEDEFAFAKNLAASYSNDPDSLKAFWEALFQKKLNTCGYLLWMDFERPEASPSVPNAEIAKKYCTEILEVLKGRKKPDGLV